MHEVLVNHLVKLAQENEVRLNDRLDMTIAVDRDVKSQTKQTTSITVSVTGVVRYQPSEERSYWV